MKSLTALEDVLPDNKGFTLLELAITISLIVLMSGAAIPSFNSYLQNQSVKQAQETLKSDIRTIQNKAITGALSDYKIGGTLTVTHWGIKFNKDDTNDDEYTYFVASVIGANTFATECTNATSGGVNPRKQGTGNLPTGMEIKGVRKCIFFDINNGDIASTVANDVHVCLGAIGSATNIRSVMFNAAGAIYNDNHASCP